MLMIGRNPNKVDKIIVKKKHDVFNGQISLFKLIAEYFWRSWSGPFFAFIFPIICITLIGYLLSYATVLGGAICLGSNIIAIYALPNSVYDFKKSSLLKRIGVTPLNPTWFIVVICFFYFVIMLISIIWCFLFSMIIFSPYWHHGPNVDAGYAINFMGSHQLDMNVQFMSLSKVLSNIEWGGYIFSFLLSTILGTTLGMMIVSLSRTAMQLQSMSVLIIIVTILIGGQTIPMCVVKTIKPIWYIGYIICPYKCILNMSTESWNGPVNANNAEFLSLWIDGNMFGSPMYMHMQNLNESTIWNVNVNYSTYSTLLLPYVKPGNTVILTKAEKILNFIIPFVWTSLFLFVTTRKFKWSSR